MRRCLFIVGFIGIAGVARPAAADFDSEWQVHDETSGPCKCTWVAPKQGRTPKVLGANASAIRVRTSRFQFALFAIPAKQSAEAYVAARLAGEHVADCGDKPKPPHELNGFQCGGGGGCNGQWEFSICAQLRPHPKGGSELMVAELSGRDGGDTIGGDLALVAAATKTIGVHAKIGGVIKAQPGAKAANTRGMRAYTAKDFVAATAAFKEAIALDSQHVIAHYNLACVASIQKDVPLAMAQLEWLAASKSPDAKKRLVKGQTDPDLDFLRETEPRARALLGLPAAVEAAK